MSKRGYISRKEAMTKNLRAKAHREQSLFRTVLEDVSPMGTSFDRRIGSTIRVRRSTPTALASSPTLVFRKICRCIYCQGFTRNEKLLIGKEGDTRVSREGKLVVTKEVCMNDGSEDFHESQLFKSLSCAPSRAQEPISISLEDVPTKIAKAKGIKREYEFVDSIERVLVLEDEDLLSMGSDDDWESIYAEDDFASVSRRPYSLVARGDGG